LFTGRSFNAALAAPVPHPGEEMLTMRAPSHAVTAYLMRH
jgi:hypothetical protein